MPEVDAWAPFDRRRLERILAPWATVEPGFAVVVEDPGGALLAGRAAGDHRPATGVRLHANVMGDGIVIARVVATGGRVDDPWMAATLEALAIAIGELVAETRTRGAIEAALQEMRSAAVAESLGTDAMELAKGRRQQRSILSLDAPDIPGYDLASHYAAARDIGGDFFEFFRLQRRGHPLGIVIADVTGKGLDAALLMAFSRPVMHSALNAASGPADALRRTNRVLVDERRGTLFITALCATLAPRSGRVRIASAGHEPPLLVAADGSPVTTVGRSGLLLGAFATLDPPEVEITLDPGDSLVFYTDGVTDARGPTGDRFGDERLLATITAARTGTAHDLVAAIREAVASFQGEIEPADDVTIVAVGRRRRLARASRPSGA